MSPAATRRAYDPLAAPAPSQPRTLPPALPCPALLVLPPRRAIYISGLVFAKLLAEGGLKAVQANNEKVGRRAAGRSNERAYVGMLYRTGRACRPLLAAGARAASCLACSKGARASAPQGSANAVASHIRAALLTVSLLFPPLHTHPGVQKAKILYDAIAASNGFYNQPVDPAVRGRAGHVCLDGAVGTCDRRAHLRPHGLSRAHR